MHLKNSYSNSPSEKKPKVIVFPSYTVADCSSIIRQRCEMCNQALGKELTLFHPAAIELCSKKVV